MKADKTYEPVPPQFNPVTVHLTLDTPAEMRAYLHVLGIINMAESGKRNAEQIALCERLLTSIRETLAEELIQELGAL